MSEGTNTNSTQSESAESSVVTELRALGSNLVNLIQSALNSDDSKNIQKEIEDGLAQAVDCVQKAADDFSQSPTGQQLKSDLNDLNQRIESGELQSKVRSDVLTAIQTANAEITKATSKFTTPASENDSAAQDSDSST